VALNKSIEVFGGDFGDAAFVNFPMSDHAFRNQIFQPGYREAVVLIVVSGHALEVHPNISQPKQLFVGDESSWAVLLEPFRQLGDEVRFVGSHRSNVVYQRFDMLARFRHLFSIG
jgi:hypothetical protein